MTSLKRLLAEHCNCIAKWDWWLWERDGNENDIRGNGTKSFPVQRNEDVGSRVRGANEASFVVLSRVSTTCMGWRTNWRWRSNQTISYSTRSGFYWSCRRASRIPRLELRTSPQPLQPYAALTSAFDVCTRLKIHYLFANNTFAMNLVLTFCLELHEKLLQHMAQIERSIT